MKKGMPEIFNKLGRKLRKIWLVAKRRYFLSGAIVLIVIIIIWFSAFGGSKPVVVRVEKGTVEEEVLATGTTRSKQEADLGFEVSGKVTQLNVEVGSMVKEGDTLVVLDQANLVAKLQKAEANLDEATVKLSTIKGQSAISYDNAYQTLATDIRDAYIKSDDAIHNNIDQFFVNPRTFQAKFEPSIQNGGLTYLGGITDDVRSQLDYERVSIENVLNQWEASQKTLGQGEDLTAAYQSAQNNLHAIQTFLGHIASAINSLVSIGYQYDSTIQGYKDTVGNARDEVNTAMANIIASRDKLVNAPKITSGDSEYDNVLIQEAQVASLKADVASIQADISKTIIKSPITGTVTKVDIEKGEIASAGANIISVISEKELQVEANVSEINIGKLTVGNKVSITLDAFPSKVYTGEIFYIDPGEVIIDRVPTYKISVKFTDPVGPEIRSGLTANLSIITRKVEDAVKVPVYAVEKRGDKQFVKVTVDDSGNTEEREVVTGLQGRDGTIEVISGLKEGEKVVAEL